MGLYMLGMWMKVAGSIQKFLSTRSRANGGNYGWWIQFIAGGLQPEVIARTEPLYYAASFGYTFLVKTILNFDKNVDLEAPGGRHGSTALQVACFRRHKETSRVLLEAGANTLTLDGSPIDGGFSALSWAKVNDWNEIVDIVEKDIVAKGENDNVEDHKQEFVAFALAVQRDVMKLRADVNADH